VGVVVILDHDGADSHCALGHSVGTSHKDSPEREYSNMRTIVSWACDEIGNADALMIESIIAGDSGTWRKPIAQPLT